MRLKDRLALALTGVTASALLGCFAVVWVMVHRDETGDLDRDVLAQAHTAALVSLQHDPQHPSVLDGQGEIPELPKPTKRYIAIYGQNGEVITSTSSFGKEMPTWKTLSDASGHRTAPLDLYVGDKHLRGVVVPLGDGSNHLFYAVSRGEVDDDLAFLLKVCVALFFGATGLTGLFARWLGNRLTRDVDAVANTARHVATGDLSVRVGKMAGGSTELRALGGDMDHMIVQLDELMRSQQTFVSHAAHELRSPLATLRGELQLAIRRPRSAEEYREAIEGALGEVEALATLAEDLLVLARVQRTRPEGASSFLGDAMSDAIRMARGPAETQSVVIEEPGESSVHHAVRGARADVARALRNLLENAVEHTPSGGRVLVKVGSGAGDIVEITVEDEGGGVSAEDAPHIFSPFYRGAKDRSGDTRGTGLGLAIVREIVRAYGGDVKLDQSKSSGGARFLMQLPRAPMPTQSADSATDSLPPSAVRLA